MLETVGARPSGSPLVAYRPHGQKRLTVRASRGFQVAKSMASDN